MSLRGLQSVVGIALAGVLLGAVVLLANATLQGYRLDLTADGLYSISDETQQILDGIEEPITLTFYFSYDEAEGVPYVREYARRVHELLESYAARSGGNIRVRQVDPRPLSEARDRVEDLELDAIPAGDGKEIYLGLIGTNQFDDVELIEFFEPEREQFLEYDLSRLIWALKNPDPPRVGLLSRLPMTEGVDPGTGRQYPNWAVMDRVEELAEIETLSGAEDIDHELDMLLIAHPHTYDDATQYAIDQYLLAGGRILMLADPIAESQSGEREQNGGTEMHVSSSDPGVLLAGWGIELDLEQALADPRSGMVVSGPDGGRDVHPGLMRIERDALADDDPITTLLDQVIVGSPGSIGVADDGPEMKALMQTSSTAAPVAVNRFVGYDSPWEITRGYRPDGNRHVVGARFSGTFASAYADGPPDDVGEQGGTHRADGSGELVLLADTDLLRDELWIQNRPGERGGSVRTAFAGNGDLIANAVENLSGGELLGGIRARGTSARPFTRVRELEREAAERYRDTQRELESELEEIEQTVRSLRAGDSDDASGTILSTEQRRDLEQARERRNEIRRELRRVEEQLDAEIDALGTRLKLLNIVAMPLVIALGALLVFGSRRRRQRTQRAAA